MFITVLFLTAKVWKPLKYPSKDEWIKKKHSINIWWNILALKKEILFMPQLEKHYETR